jgi:hypothetical protein
MKHRRTITIPKSRETIVREALAREEAVRLRRLEEAHIVDHLDPIPTELPSWLPAKEKRMFNLFSALRP